MFVEPDCAGKWIDLAMFGRSWISAKSSSGKSFGCGDVNRMRKSGLTLATLCFHGLFIQKKFLFLLILSSYLSSRSANRKPPSRGL